MTDLSTPSSASPSTSGTDEEPEGVPIADGEAVRWRRQAGARWNMGTVIRRETDGSIAVRDTNGAWRSIPVDRLEVQTVTKRGAKKWVPLADRGPVPLELTAPGPEDDPDTATGEPPEAPA
jgi:hypothetical protein